MHQPDRLVHLRVLCHAEVVRAFKQAKKVIDKTIAQSVPDNWVRHALEACYRNAKLLPASPLLAPGTSVSKSNSTNNSKLFELAGLHTVLLI